MFNGMVPEEYRRPGWETFLECWKSELECCSIELLTMFVFCGRLLPWPADECAGTFDQYQSSRHKEMATRLPQLAEIAVIGEIANLFHSDGHVGRFEEWMDRAICDAPGRKVVQEYLCSCRQARQRVEALHILGRPITTKAVDSSNGTNATAFTEEDIRLCAYFKWAAAGRQEDDGVYCWLEAEKELLAGS
jgi:hypothetical protein